MASEAVALTRDSKNKHLSVTLFIINNTVTGSYFAVILKPDFNVQQNNLDETNSKQESVT
jgi:hypothetical protein